MSDPPTFTAFVKYEQPSFEELKRRFSRIDTDLKKKRPFPSTHIIADGEYMEVGFDEHEEKRTENREVTFECVFADVDEDDSPASTREVLVEMRRRGLCPALFEEQLAFDEKYPDEKLKHPIIALGSHLFLEGGAYTDEDGQTQIEDDEYVPGLLGSQGHANLFLATVDANWMDWRRVCFLAIRK